MLLATVRRAEPARTLEQELQPEALPLPKPEIPISCRKCGHQITTPREATSVDGVHERTFRNPAGYSFHVLCYRRAPGCREASGPVHQDSWFPGTSWSIAVCGECHEHLGWYYSARDQNNFYGLIATRLVLPK